MESFLADYPTLQIISYIITVLIGGVGYKYLQLLLKHRETTNHTEREGNQLLIQNLQERVNQITDRVNELEDERKQLHERELTRAIELERSNAEVKLLQEKVKYLEETVKGMRFMIQTYRKKYGSISEDIDFEENK
ncbi:MAG: hypothetical protein WD512_18545 [Candidatus Paceibacterota bacterium]